MFWCKYKVDDVSTYQRLCPSLISCFPWLDVLYLFTYESDWLFAGLSDDQPAAGENAEVVLYAYQEEVAKRCRAGENDIIILPTGTGKTYVTIKLIIQHLKIRRDQNGQPFI